MADEVDLANDNIDNGIEMQRALIAQQLSKPELPPIGRCYYCEEEFEEGSKKLFCDDNCGEDYQTYIVGRRS